MDKRYQIFISSTFADLEEERGKVMEVILKENCFPAGMELFPAMDMKLFEYIKKIIDDSDYFILIIGGRYGSEDKESGLSWTEREYDYAVSRKIPVMVFDYDNYNKLPTDKTDQNNEKLEKLIAFKKKVAENRPINKWHNADNLALNVSQSLHKTFEQIPRTGWVRGDTVTSGVPQEQYDELQKELVVLRAHKESYENNPSNSMIKLDSRIVGDEWDKKYSATMKIEYRYLNSLSSNTFIDIVYDLKKWFRLIADTIKNLGFLAENDYIVRDMNSYFNQSPFIKKELIKKEETYIKSEWNKCFFKDISRISTSDIRISKLKIENDDLLIIIETLKDLGIIAKVRKYSSSSEWELTTKGNKLYNLFFVDI